MKNVNIFTLKKELFDINPKNKKEVSCFLPVHLNTNKIEKNLLKADGSCNEQYYKWQFLTSFVDAGLCEKQFIGVEIQLPKGNKTSNPLKVDACVFDDASWFSHYTSFWNSHSDDKWDEMNWLQEHLLCCIEFKKEDSKDIKGVFNSQLKSYMSSSLKSTVFGILYDCGRMYLFKENGKQYLRLSDEFNQKKKNGGYEMTFDNPDSYENLLSFDEMINYENTDSDITDYSKRKIDDLRIIAKNDSKKLNEHLYNVLETMDKCGLVNQKGYNILIQLLALKIYDEKHYKKYLNFYINPDEEYFDSLAAGNVQEFLNRIKALREDAKRVYKKILGEDSLDFKQINIVKVAIQIVKQFQHYSFSGSKRNNLYQLVFNQFASKFAKEANSQFITPLQIIDFIVDIVNPRNQETIIDPTVGIADFLSVSYVKADGTLDDHNIFGSDIDPDMIKLATLNMLLNGDGQATLESIPDGLGAIKTKFDEDGNLITLIPAASENNKYNYNGNWDDRPDDKLLKKFDVVLTNPPFGKKRAWEPKGEDINLARCYELFNLSDSSKIDMGLIFLENAVRILKTNGRMAIILSNSIASVDAYRFAREWLCKNVRIVATFDLPPNIFAEAGVAPTIIVAYKPDSNRLKQLIESDYEVFSREIKNVGYEVKEINKVKTFVPQYKLNDTTFEKEVYQDGSPMLDEDFTKVLAEFKDWANKQEKEIKDLFLG